MKEKTKRIIYYSILVILFLSLDIFLKIFPENKILVIFVYIIIILFIYLIFRKSDVLYNKDAEERKRMVRSALADEKNLKRINMIAYFLSGLMILAGLISYFSEKNMDALMVLGGFGSFFIVFIFLANKFCHKED